MGYSALCDYLNCLLWLRNVTMRKRSRRNPPKQNRFDVELFCSWLQIVARTKRTADWPGSARVDNLQKTAMMASTHWYTASWLISRDVIVIKLSWSVLWIWHLGSIACKKSNTWSALSQVKIRETHNEKGWRAFLSWQGVFLSSVKTLTSSYCLLHRKGSFDFGMLKNTPFVTFCQLDFHLL